MYVSSKDIDTISELSAYVAGAVESLDPDDEDLVNYWTDLEKRVDKLERKMQRQFERQK